MRRDSFRRILAVKKYFCHTDGIVIRSIEEDDLSRVCTEDVLDPNGADLT